MQDLILDTFPLIDWMVMCYAQAHMKVYVVQSKMAFSRKVSIP